MILRSERKSMRTENMRDWNFHPMEKKHLNGKLKFFYFRHFFYNKKISILSVFCLFFFLHFYSNSSFFLFLYVLLLLLWLLTYEIGWMIYFYLKNILKICFYVLFNCFVVFFLIFFFSLLFASAAVSLKCMLIKKRKKNQLV